MTSTFDVIKQHIKWLDDRCKKLKAEVEQAKRLRMDFGMYEDCGESYDHGVTEAEARLSECVNIKVSTEKWLKKLRHEAERQSQIDSHRSDL